MEENTLTRVEIDVAAAFIPALYNGTSEITRNDIAVLKVWKVSSCVYTVINGLSEYFLKLKKEFDLGPNSGQAKIPLPCSTKLLTLDRYNSFARKEAVVSGFGWIHVEIKRAKDENGDEYEYEDGYSYGELLKAKAGILSNIYCQRYYNFTIVDSEICAMIVQHDGVETQGICTVSTIPCHLLSYCSNNIV